MADPLSGDSDAATPRTDDIKTLLLRKYPDPLPEGPQKLLYYMEAAECFGQECAKLERDLAEAKVEQERLRAGWIEADKIIRDAPSHARLPKVDGFSMDAGGKAITFASSDDAVKVMDALRAVWHAAPSTARVAHSKSEYKRLSAQGADVLPPAVSSTANGQHYELACELREEADQLPEGFQGVARVMRQAASALSSTERAVGYVNPNSGTGAANGANATVVVDASQLEREHLGDPDKKTGIYAASTSDGGVPNAYVVVMDSPDSKRGFWFVGAYHEKETAEMLASGRGNYRVVPAFFAPSATKRSEP